LDLQFEQNAKSALHSVSHDVGKLNDVVGAVFAVEPDPFKAAQLMIDHIDAKRQALGI